MSRFGESGKVAVRKWKETKKIRNLTGIKREDLSQMIDIIKDDMTLKEGADQFFETLQKTFVKTTSSGDTSRVLGDLNDTTMIFAIFHCAEAASDNDKINLAYVINTLSTDLPREDTKLDIATVKDFANANLTAKMIEHLTKDSEAELNEKTEAWPQRVARVPRDAEDGEHVMETIDGPSITFRCKSLEGDRLELTILCCEDLPDLDWWTKSDPYVTVKVGGKKEHTETIKDDLNPKFDEESSTFIFDVGSGVVARNARIQLKVWDGDSLCDDFIGQANVALSKADMTGEPIKLGLFGPNAYEAVLSSEETLAIYRLFAAMDTAGTGKLDHESLKSLVVNPTEEAAELLNEIDSFMEDTDNSGDVSFVEFLEQFRLHEDTPSAEEIDKLAAEFRELLKEK